MEDLQIFTSLRYDPALISVSDRGYTNTGRNQKSSAFYMLDLHRDRMLRAATYWDWKPAIETISGDEGLNRLENLLQTWTSQVGNAPHRIKILLDRHGKLGYAIAPTPAMPLANLLPSRLPEPDSGKSVDEDATKGPSQDPEFEILVDTKVTTSSEYTHYKSTNRGMYDDARNRARINVTDQKEVLLVNDDGSIMEGSISTPYFWRNGKWVTPPVSPEFKTGQGSGGNDGTTRRWALRRQLIVEEVVPAQSLQNGEECWFSTGVRGFVFGRIKIESSNARG